MAAATILHVGDDVCSRIPMMESSGLVVLTCECSVKGIRNAFARETSFSAVAFHNTFVPPAPIVISTARSLSAAPFVLFEDPSIPSDERGFDLIISTLTPPTEWLKSIAQAIEEAVKIQDFSRQLYQESAAAQATTRALRATAARNRSSFGSSDRSGGLHYFMDPLSDWHSFKVTDRETYPKVDAPIEVKFEDGATAVGYSSKFFPRSGQPPDSPPPRAWRYIKNVKD